MDWKQLKDLGLVSGGGSGALDWNIEYSQTAPSDTTKLWAKCGKPSILTADDALIGTASPVGETVAHLDGAGNGAAVLIGDNIYYILGSYVTASGMVQKILKANLSTGDLTEINPTDITPLGYNGVGACTDGQNIYTYGGIYGSYSQNSLHKYSEDFSLTKLGATTNSAGYASIAIVNGFIYIFGGRTGSSTLDAIWKYNISSSTLGQVNAYVNSGSGAAAMACASYGDFIYLFGARDSSGTAINIIQKYDTTNDSITTLSASLPESLKNAAAGVLNDKIYIYGGIKTDGTLSDKIYIFSPGTETIELSEQTLPFAMSNISVAQGENVVYLCGGIVGGSSYLSVILYQSFTETLANQTGHLSLSSNGTSRVIVSGVGGAVSSGVKALTIGNASNIGEAQELYYYNGTNWVLI